MMLGYCPRPPENVVTLPAGAGGGGGGLPADVHILQTESTMTTP